MITIEAFWRGPDAEDRRVTYADQVTDEIEANGPATVDACNPLIAEYEAETGKTIDSCHSGWRPLAVNEHTSNAGEHSWHLRAGAEDVGGADDVVLTDGGHKSSAFARWCATHQDRLKEYGLYMEDWHYTPTWTHLSPNPPHSGRTMYMPFDPAKVKPPIPLSEQP